MNCFCTLRRLNSQYEQLLSARSVHICQLLAGSTATFNRLLLITEVYLIASQSHITSDKQFFTQENVIIIKYYIDSNLFL